METAEPLTVSDEIHRCEVRWCIANGAEWFKTYMVGMEKHRGKEGARRLYDAVRQQAKLGNTGKTGEWINP